MEDNIAVSVKNVSKLFNIPHDMQYGLKGTLLNLIRGKNTYEKFYALRDISFDVKQGGFVGIIGRNGSGKSTLLKIIAGILKPTHGTIKVNGKLAPFLELGLGFQGELSGKDNVYLYGAVLGLTKKQIDKRYNEIVRFAELKRFIDTKLKNYSSGMQARLAFSIVIQAEADILLIDEVLAVGDIHFQKKCYKYFGNLKNEIKSVLIVTHDLNLVEKFCDTAIYINNGKIIGQGEPRRVIDLYRKINI